MGTLLLIIVALVSNVALPRSGEVWRHYAGAALFGNVIPFLLLSYGESDRRQYRGRSHRRHPVAHPHYRHPHPAGGTSHIPQGHRLVADASASSFSSARGATDSALPAANWIAWAPP